MSRASICFCLAAGLLIFSPSVLLAIVEVGTHYPIALDTPIDYAGADREGEPRTVWVHVLTHPGATYVAIHFVDFELGPGDYLSLCDAQGDQEYTMTGRGKMNAGTFWARHIKGDTVVLELMAVGAGGGRGFRIDEYAAGDVEIGFGGEKSVCSTDDRLNAVCFQDSHPTFYERGRAVVRLLSEGSGFCTGSLVSPYNHVMTNNHCIYTASRALNTDFEFMAEAPNCNDPNCRNCYPGVVYSGGTLLKTRADYDYTLILLNEGDPASTYGYLEFDNRLPVAGEQIYIPQHPGARAKELALYSTYPADTGGVARIQSVTEPPCQGGTHQEIGYFADTEPGASGSPVLAASSHRLVALHHCGGCPNTAVPIHLIYPEVQTDVLGLNLPSRIAPGAVAVNADSTYGGDMPASAIDHNLATRWRSTGATTTHWLQLDLGLLAPVTGFRVWHAGAGGASPSYNTQAFLIQSAPDAGGPWTTEFVGNNAAQEDVSTFTCAQPVSMRHVRLYITDPGADDYARICEFEVIADPTMTAGAPSGPNAALQATQAVASSTFGPGYGADKAIDGVVSHDSKWTSQTDVYPPHALTLDLGGIRPVLGFILRQASAGGETTDYNARDLSFQSARSMSGPWFTESRARTPGLVSYEARTFVSPKDLRYVRLHLDDPSAVDRYARVPEFEVITFAGACAEFKGVPTSGRAPLTVQFTDLSMGEVTWWLWDFGDGQTGISQNPSHRYDRPGDYTVSLTIDGPGGSDARTKVDYIHVEPTQADFDEDGDVDQSDFGHLQACYTGSGVQQTDPACMNADLDNDLDVDQQDLAVFAPCLGGAGMPPPAGCGM